MNTLLSQRQNGTSMIEVLVTIVILLVGLLGLAGLQARLQTSEMESYQRAQALILLNDMASRLATNRNFAADYVTTAADPIGVDIADCDALPVTSTAETDRKEWCDALQGASEKASDDSNVGVMVGGRGCVEDLGSGQYMITVAWQGLTPIPWAPDPLKKPACGLNQYNGDVDSNCVDDLCRRVVTTIVRIAAL